MEPTEQMPPRPKSVSFAIWVMRVLIALELLDALFDPMGALPSLVLYWLMLRGLKKGNAWTLYGGALLLDAMLVIILVTLGLTSWLLVALAAVVTSLLTIVLIFAGRALATRRPDRVRWGWVVASTCMVLFFTVFRVFVIPTGSMEDTLFIGDHLLTRQVGIGAFGRGQLIVFGSPDDARTILVKRVIAIGGDRLKIRDKVLFINGVAQNEPYATHKTEYMDLYRDNFPSEPNAHLYSGAMEMLQKNVVNGEVVVPAGRYFVMGDNRDSSLDSRYWGFVDASHFVAKPILVYFSEKQETDQISGRAKRPLLFHWNLVRWERTLKLVR